MLKTLVWIVGALALLFIGFAAYVRLAGDDAATWHIDPATAERTGRPNDFVVAPDQGGDMASPVFKMTPEALLARFEEVALAEPRVTLLGETEGYVTLIQRSAVMAYPDYISARAVAVEGGAALHIYSRSRYGYGDAGVNKARVLSWLEKL